ncbi:MAG TPA: hypothetical protein VGQ96_05240 [Candidatus Eremiobacteraceae bacterium]|nr:hypothetical protein [Candidatus Eremiobacteraceae bacterium]
MRALFVAAALATAIAALPAHAMELAPKAGETITQTQLLGYLFVAPQRGDWLRYRVSVDDSEILVKTTGFGVGRLRGSDTAFFETETQTPGLINSPVQTRMVAGGNLVWKMFVDAPNFDDATRLYTFAAGVIKIGDGLFRLGSGQGEPVPAYRQTLQSLLLYGTLPLPDNRPGVVESSKPEDVRIGGRTVHTVHTTVDFEARAIGMATGLPEARVEAWQTTDVPLGLVTIRSTTNGHVYSVDLIAYGHGSYRAVINQQFESIPYFPG